jgi:hypothetical protein
MDESLSRNQRISSGGLQESGSTYEIRSGSQKNGQEYYPRNVPFPFITKKLAVFLQFDVGPIYPAWQFSRATTDGAATLCAAPSQLAWQKKVIRVKFFDKRFIFKNCLNFGLFLSKSPRRGLRTLSRDVSDKL